MINGAPQVMHLTVDLHVHLIKASSPMAKALHPADALSANVAGEQRAEPLPPEPDCLMANIDPALEQQVFDVPQRQRVAYLHHYHVVDYLRGRVEIPKRVGDRLGHHS